MSLLGIIAIVVVVYGVAGVFGYALFKTSALADAAIEEMMRLRDEDN